jgi:hypothetical protein
VLGVQTLGRPEHTAAFANVFTSDENTRVACYFFIHRHSNGVYESHNGHRS